ncbi:argininosuccinate synthase [Candidatus Woesearchaeota archaeon]|jgi:argininosuccinate synthase|nr:argininosuccinate synthase [Candidatus Woesearchaeota archaeon]MBT4368477.1 argininosuccinate synthase [Candidatus Woesearchaeota archaeon]MBT4712966.1 argininosuccinate synthase [Candidatus Woesearchaeota archaeon]MBT6639878.1 argininosuccinate synthase [Candidatus Woesearchaeota archaeon]MBT7134050.1 argininosuccinate synthase [Candidatus Woesearchaeota archaeon]
MKKVILAYSGGLDTSIILHWLINKGYEVVCYVADVGQEEDFDKAKEKALLLGASKVYIEDLKEEFVQEYIFQALKANSVYEGKYLLGTSLARPIIAKKHIEIAEKESTNIFAHGATGKGNDQVRFELTIMKFVPDAEIISPWKDPEFLAKFKGRTDLINYAHKHKIPIESTAEKPYSMDDNLMHISYEAGKLEDPKYEPKEDMFKKTTSPLNAPDKETKIMIEFKEGIPVSVTHENNTVTGSLELFQYLNKLGSENGIGRIDLVENRFVGMKSRGVYETPAGTILLIAHKDIEGLVLDREVCHLKDMLMPKIAELIYNGFWFSPEMDFLMSAVNQSQINVDGKVYLTLYKGNAFVTSRESDKSLYNENIASMDKLGGYDQTDAKGFIKLNALRLKLGPK